MPYAEGTSVPIEKTKTEIEATLKRYGADQFFSGWSANKAAIGFRMHNRNIKMVLPLPVWDIAAYRYPNPKETWKNRRTDVQAREFYDAHLRQRWRSFLLIIKAKLEAVESGVTTFETEWMPYTILPNGSTVAEHVAPQIEEAYRSGKMPPLLGMG